MSMDELTAANEAAWRRLEVASGLDRARWSRPDAEAEAMLELDCQCGFDFRSVGTT